MESFDVKELMVPLDEYAITVGQDASLYDAVLALEAAQEHYDQSRTLYAHRSILVVDQHKKVIGKISQSDALRALVPCPPDSCEDRILAEFGFSSRFIRTTLAQHEMWNDPLADICKKASEINVRAIMHTPSEGEYISEKASLAEAIHQLIQVPHQSLLVTGSSGIQDIVGVLRLTDLFAAVFHVMKQCRIDTLAR